MPIDLTLFHTAWLYTHIGIGFLGLFAFWVPVFARKGSKLHMRAGTVFVWSGYVVAVTALVSSAWALLAPVHFLSTRGISEAAAAREAERIEFLFAILFFLALGVLVGLRMGVRLVRTKQHPEQFSTPALKGLYLSYGVTGAALFGYGVWHLVTEGVSGGYVLCAVLGAIGAIETRGAMRFFANPRPTPMAWWYMHMESMIGCGVGFHTAFLIFGLGRLISSDALPEWFLLVAIFLPAAIGISAASLGVRYYKRRFAEA